MHVKYKCQNSVLEFELHVFCSFLLQTCIFQDLTSCNTKMLCIVVSVILLSHNSNTTKSQEYAIHNTQIISCKNITISGLP
jgi:hypothetical protein